jgi:hypothetical protein
MLTPQEKILLLKLLNSAQVSGTRQTVQKTLEDLDALVRKIEAMPVEDEHDHAVPA